eukprot:359833-Chlamydomonas_euryale.AAC.3
MHVFARHPSPSLPFHTRVRMNARCGHGAVHGLCGVVVPAAASVRQAQSLVTAPAIPPHLHAPQMAPATLLCGSVGTHQPQEPLPGFSLR